MLWFDDDDGTNDATVEGMAYRLAVAVAAREVHEALEWTRLDGSLLIDPHQASVVGPASRDAAEYPEVGWLTVCFTRTGKGSRVPLPPHRRRRSHLRLRGFATDLVAT